MARTIKVGFDDQLTGVIESTPANRLAFRASSDEATQSLKSLVEFHAGNLVAALPEDAEPTADELLDYVVSRMRGKRAWAERVDPGLDVPKMNAFCPTGEGGGQDNSCPPGGGGGGGSGSRSARTLKDLEQDLPRDPNTGRRGVKEVSGLSVKTYRVGGTDDKHGRGVFFSGDREGAEAYAGLHPGEEVREHVVELGKALLAGHQNDVTREFFGKSYGDMHAALSRRSKDSVEGGRKLDVKIAKEAVKRGYHGIVYLNPAPPAKSEVAVFKGGRVTSNAFCPTGEGGGIDPSCSPDGTGQGLGPSIAPTATPLGKTPRLRGFGEAPSEAFTKEQARIDAEARAKGKPAPRGKATPSEAARSAQPKDADDVPTALKATSTDVRREVESTVKDFQLRRGRVTVGEARDLADKLAGMTVKDMRAVAKSLGVKTPTGRKAEVTRELAERFREKIHADKGLKEVSAGNWVPKAEADRIVADVRHEGGAAWRVDDMPGDSASRDRVFVGFEGSAQQAERHGFPLSERVRARLAKAGKGRSRATRVRNALTWNANPSAALAELSRPLPVWLEPSPDGSVSVREATDRGDEIRRVAPGQSFLEWSAPELWQLGRGLFELVPHSQAAAELMLSGLPDDAADDLVFDLGQSDEEALAVLDADPNRNDDGKLAEDFRREVKPALGSFSQDDHGDDGWRPVK